MWITFWFELSKYGKHEMRTILSNQVQIFSVNHMTPKSHNSHSNYSSNLLKGCAIQLGIYGVQEETRTSKVNSCFLAQVRYMYMCHQAFKVKYFFISSITAPQDAHRRLVLQVTEWLTASLYQCSRKVSDNHELTTQPLVQA